MDLDKIKNVRKLRREIGDAIRGVGSLKQHELINLAKKSGYVLNGKRGKENVYVHSLYGSAPSLSIPDHGRGLKKFLAKGVLQRIDEVLITLEEQLKDQEEGYDAIEDQGG